MKLLVFPKLSGCSRKSMLKTTSKWGHHHDYMPQMRLLERLADELNMTVEQVLEQIEHEREYLIQEQGKKI
jgi:hypothetical protein